MSDEKDIHKAPDGWCGRFAYGFYRDARMVQVGPVARMLYVQVALFSAESLQDGALQRAQLRYAAGDISQPVHYMRKLVRAGLLTETRDGWQIPPRVWRKYNRTRDEVEEWRRTENTRKRAWRARQRDASATTDGEEQRDESATRDATRPRQRPRRVTETETETETETLKTSSAAAAAFPRSDVPAAAAAANDVSELITAAVAIRREAMGHRVHSPVQFEAALRAGFVERADEFATRLAAGESAAGILAEITGADPLTIYDQTGEMP